MFIENQTDTISNEKITLAFLRSLNVQAFPCGRRRSTTIDTAGTRIPFDPEARLNTEANNIKHSNINGFAQTYLESWDDVNNKLTVSLAGYIFNIDLDPDYRTPKQFGANLANTFKLDANSVNADINSIYLNILLEETPLFLGEPRAYTTFVLGRLAVSEDESALDLPISGKIESKSAVEDYYFSGLAFSYSPLASAVRKTYSEGDDSAFDTRDDFVYSVVKDDNSVAKKRIISLHLLEKIDEQWAVHIPSKLPTIKHGSTEDSVVMNDVTAHSAKVGSAHIDTITVPYDGASERYSETVVGSEGITTPKLEAEMLHADGITIGENLRSEGKVSAKHLEADIDVTAKELYQKIDDNNTMRVPYIELVQDDSTGHYQLHISSIGKKQS